MTEFKVNDDDAVCDDKDRYWPHGCIPGSSTKSQMMEDTEYTATAQMPTGSKMGDLCYIIQMSVMPSIYFAEVGTVYTYTWTSQGNDDGDDEWGGLDGGDEQNDIELAQVKNLKLKNKAGRKLYVSFGKVSNAEGYQIQYAMDSSMNKAKSLKTKATKGYIVNKKGKKAKLKKGKTYYVHVRACANDSDGELIYGDWSDTVSVKIKK